MVSLFTSSFLMLLLLHSLFYPWNFVHNFWACGCRYSGHPSHLGIELLNEPPAATVPFNILVSYYIRGYQIVQNCSSTAYVILCQRIGTADPMELIQANVGISNVVVDLHYYLFDPYFTNINSSQNIDFIYKARAPQLQALKSSNGPLHRCVYPLTILYCFYKAIHFANFKEVKHAIILYWFHWSLNVGTFEHFAFNFVSRCDNYHSLKTCVERPYFVPTISIHHFHNNLMPIWKYLMLVV
jgi:hypothetical protein